MTTHDTPHNKALELADRIANDENEHLPVSRSEIATLLRSQASDLAEARAEIARLRADAARLEVQRDDARFALRKLKEHIQGDCV